MAEKIFVSCFYKWIYAPYECTKKQYKLGNIHIKSKSKIKAREMVEIKIESSLS